MDVDQVQAYFDSVADRWDTLCHHNPEKLQAIVALAQIPENAAVVDIACGTGILFSEILKRSPRKLLGVDLSKKMIQTASGKFHNPALQLAASSIFDITDQGFDTAFLYSAYPHFPDKPNLALHIARLLRKGGRFLLAHSESRATINARHQHSSASPISVPLRTVLEEADVFRPFFELDIFADTPDFFILSGTKK